MQASATMCMSPVARRALQPSCRGFCSLRWARQWQPCAVPSSRSSCRTVGAVTSHAATSDRTATASPSAAWPLVSDQLRWHRMAAVAFGRRGAATTSSSSDADGRKTDDTTATDKTGGCDAEKPSDTAAAKEESAGTAAEEPIAAKEEKELSEVEKLQKILEELEEKKKAKRTELLLALADFENHKKKYMRERLARRRNATINFARKMVEVYGEFQDAFTQKSEDVHESCEALLEGIVLTKDVYKAALDRYDVVPIVPELGTEIIAARHENAGAVVSSEHPPDTIAEVVREGWTLAASGAATHDAVLQKARVKVAKTEA
eukprot:TRINITY_DN69734_c0_g1_i1.p1 TRINITY_DN69734_c0_g1~~TRINITY_DN69734_c0_g1_i1.p1  ORF type:complete len:319 (+),score=73.05 TRINITY_DN69734_c0_g1_i1:63-1019(+)